MAHHHDNFDNFDSTYQPWNSVAIGPKKDIVGGWAKAVRAAGLRLALTSHGDRAWSWYQAAQGSDPSGPLAGVPYDGLMTKADGKGLVVGGPRSAGPLRAVSRDWQLQLAAERESAAGQGLCRKVFQPDH